jgi:DNA-binding NarL/FixJ family response regulator
VRKIRVILINESAFTAEALKRVLDGDGRFQAFTLLGSCSSVDAMHEISPDVIVIDARSYVNMGLDVIRNAASLGSSLRTVLLGADEHTNHTINGMVDHIGGFVPQAASLDFLKDSIQAVGGGTVACLQQRISSPPTSLQLFTSEHLTDNFIRSKRLTVREVDILQLLSRGLTNQEIARVLNLSTHTIKNHVYKAFNKLGIHKRAHALGPYYWGHGNGTRSSPGI